MKRSEIALVVVLGASIVCACSVVWVRLKGIGNPFETSATTESSTAIVLTAASATTSAGESEDDKGPLEDEEVLEGFENYLHFKIKDLEAILDEGKKPCTWGIASSDKNEVMIMFKSHTGSLLRYHVNRNSGKTYVTSYSVEYNDYFRTKETLNIRDYLDKKPTPTPYAIKPSGNTTAETAARPKVKISNAVSKTATVGGAKLPYKIPKVSITGKNTDSANKKMKSELGKYDLKGSSARSITYSYHTSPKLISILVHISDNDSTTVDTYKVYNIAVSSGKIVRDSTAVKLAGSSTKKFFAKVKATYKKFGGGSGAPASFAKSAQKQNLKRVSYKYLTPYVNKNGHLCFLGYVSYYGGAEKGYRVFDATSKKLIV
ncbi:MAG: hypothetical protein E7386_00315 [Ruminococcaceae bacterium]|nr:hypothetical protein [Oscillospiraceae bacterium]